MKKPTLKSFYSEVVKVLNSNGLEVTKDTYLRVEAGMEQEHDSTEIENYFLVKFQIEKEDPDYLFITGDSIDKVLLKLEFEIKKTKLEKQYNIQI
jgi:hypothetical protein